MLYECLKADHIEKLHIETDRKWFEKEEIQRLAPNAKVVQSTESDEEKGRKIHVKDKQNDLLITFE